jgi:hypothetical protein
MAIGGTPDPSERSFSMTLLQVLIVAVASMVLLALLRVIRVRLGRTPQPEGLAKIFFLVAFVLGPPIVLGALPLAAGSAAYPVLLTVPLYAILLAILWMLMGGLALVAERLPQGRSRKLLVLALAGSEGDPYEVAVDAPVSAMQAEGVAAVDRTNAVFPRGGEFPHQIDRPGFRSAWDALDVATATLEGVIAGDVRRGSGVASTVRATAIDARSRLDTLRGLAVDAGQVWAAR